MTLQARIVTAFLFMAVLVIVVASVGVWGIRSLAQQIEIIRTNSYPTAIVLLRLQQEHIAQRAAVRLLLRSNATLEERRKGDRELTRALEEAPKAIQEYDVLPRDQVEDKMFQNFKAKWANWERLLGNIKSLLDEYKELGVLDPRRTLVELRLAGRTNTVEFAKAQRSVEILDKILEIKRLESDRAFTEAEQALEELVSYSKGFAQKTFQQAERSVKAANFWIVVWTVIGPITAIVFGIVFSNTIAKPLGAKIATVVAVAEKIAEGDLTSQVQEAEIKDEIGRLLDAFRLMTISLNNLIAQVNQSGVKITSSATQIAASGKQLEATVNEQVASTNQVVATAKEIAATSTELSRVMREVSHLADTTTNAAATGQKDLAVMEKTMRQLADATASISVRLGVISEKANNINTIVTTITKVADQTNLLSLNAAIEAEKAGEYGLGFAVVAREIRRLADQTAIATLDIENMVQEMQSAVASGVMEMDKFTKEVERAVEDIRNVGGKLTQVITQVQELAPRFEAVNQGMEAQAIGANQISEAMIQLSEAANQTAAALREINRAIEQLNEAGKELRREISRFQLQQSRLL
ncbi:MAG: methyl-accepting chemotaxis protein [Pseudanabaenaceae cyanobacterium SKYGB_i_bin29]|nr:methyl-accepting chemotaxis protein [Pseudanabaenaceae cyanobacterium SKYG29]MDW8420360.1 methyl-accepting chemotaxis protein [Pseudanabaenaceae cyanobacterium SKYGB_i_bin29]